MQNKLNQNELVSTEEDQGGLGHWASCECEVPFSSLELLLINIKNIRKYVPQNRDVQPFNSLYYCITTVDSR